MCLSVWRFPGICCRSVLSPPSYLLVHVHVSGWVSSLLWLLLGTNKQSQFSAACASQLPLTPWDPGQMEWHLFKAHWHFRRSYLIFPSCLFSSGYSRAWVLTGLPSGSSGAAQRKPGYCSATLEEVEPELCGGSDTAMLESLPGL